MTHRSTRSKGLRREIISRASRTLGKWLAGAVAVLMVGTGLVVGSAVPATAMEGASLLVVKKVDGIDAQRDLRPGDSVTYRVEFRVNDEDADAPVRVADVMPAEFAGWQISDLTAVVGGSTTGVTLDLPGIASGPSPAGPVAGTIGASAADRTITVGVEQPVQPGAGNTDAIGMSTRHTGVLQYTVTIPSDLAPNDPVLRKDLVNTATFSANAGEQPLSVSDTAAIEVDNPVKVDVEPSKSWNPESQSYHPGETSTITIGATQASNVNASALILQDPVTAPNGATSLNADNPFTYVDFAGFTAPSDPTTNLPNGATSATVEVYRLSGGSWNWEAWNASIPNSEIGGVRTTYTGDIPSGTTVNQGLEVEQRATHRTSGSGISDGWEITNKVRATVEVPGENSVSKEGNAPFSVGSEKIDVSAQKRFFTLPDGAESTNLTGVTAGDTVGVVLRAINGEAPQSITLDTLTIAEPAAGSNAKFFGEDLMFAGFDNSNPSDVWPVGATGAELTWHHDGGPTVVNLAADASLPAAPSGEVITGFEIVFSGAIAPGAASQIHYELASNSSDSFVGPGATEGPFRNTIDVTGEKEGLDPDTANAGASVSYVAPRIAVTIDKRVGPGLVMPGDDVVVQLDTEAKTSGGRTKPTEIVVEDVFGGEGTFWDGFDATQILPPISRPTNGETPSTQADLQISTLR